MALIVSEHAREQAARRGIPNAVVMAVTERPEQAMVVRPDREIRQSRMAVDASLYLVRVVVDRVRDDDIVITVYRTSQIEKYWRTS